MLKIQEELRSFWFDWGSGKLLMCAMHLRVYFQTVKWITLTLFISTTTLQTRHTASDRWKMLACFHPSIFLYRGALVIGIKTRRALILVVISVLCRKELRYDLGVGRTVILVSSNTTHSKRHILVHGCLVWALYLFYFYAEESTQKLLEFPAWHFRF